MNYDIVENAKVGQLWELGKHWSNVMGYEHPQAYLLVRRVGDTNVWEALCLETNKLEALTLSSLLYEHVA